MANENKNVLRIFKTTIANCFAALDPRQWGFAQTDKKIVIKDPDGVTQYTVPADGADATFNDLTLTGALNGLTTLGVDHLDFDPTAYAASSATYEEGRMFYNERGWMQYYNDKSDLIIEAGATMLSRFINNTGTTITKGQALWVASIDAGVPNYEVGLASCRQYDENYVIGIAANTALDTEEVIFMQKGILTGIDTSTLNLEVPVWVGGTAGTITTTPPTYPCRHVLVGAVLVQHATLGVLGVNMHITDYQSEFEGTIVEKLALEVVVNSGNVYLMAETNGGGNFHMQYGGRYYEIDAVTAAGSPDASGRAYVLLNEGTSTTAIENYVYTTVTAGNAVLTAATSRPSTNYAYVGQVTINNDTKVTSDGPMSLRQHTNARVNGEGDDIGLVSALAERLRLEGVKYISGVDITDLSITTNGSSLDDVNLDTGSGGTYQLWNQGAFAAYDLSVDGAWVANSTGSSPAPEKYEKLTSLGRTCAYKSDGTALSTNNRGNIVVFFGSNSADGGSRMDKMFVNLTTDVYANDLDAYNDISGFADVGVPEELKGTAFLAYRIPYKYTTSSGGTIQFVGTILGKPTAISLRGNPIGLTSSGGSLGAQQEFADSVFRIFDNGDDTKELAFECSGITTATTRTVTQPDYSGTMALLDSGGVTTNNVPKYDGTKLVDSAMSESGGDVSMSGDLTVDTDTLHVDSANGNIGIGTALPFNSSGYATATINGSTGGQIILSTGVVKKCFMFNSTNSLFLGTLDSGYIALYTGNTEKARFDASGNFGVGNTTINAKLDIDGDIAIVDGMTAPSATSGKAKLYVDSADGDLKIIFGDGTVKTIVTDS